MLPSLGLAVCAYCIARLVTLSNAPQSKATMVIGYLAAAFVALCAFDILMSGITLPKG